MSEAARNGCFGVVDVVNESLPGVGDRGERRYVNFFLRQ